MSGRCRIKELSDVRTMPDQGTQRCQDDAGSRNSAMSGQCRIKELIDIRTIRERPVEARCYHDDYRRTNAVTTTTGEQTLSRRLQENKRCHDDYGRTNAVTTMVGLKTPPERQHKRRVDALTLSDRQQAALSILLLVLYMSGDAKSNVAWMCVDLGVCCLCPFRPFTPVKAESSLLSRHSLFFSCLSFVSRLSTHTLIVVYSS